MFTERKHTANAAPISVCVLILLLLLVFVFVHSGNFIIVIKRNKLTTVNKNGQ